MVNGVEAPVGPSPTALVATTRKTYVDPGVRPEISHETPVVVQLAAPGSETTRYDVMGDPESLAASQLIVAVVALVPVAVTLPGALGTVRGVTGADTPLSGPSPTPFEALTVNTYAVPFVSPLTSQLKAPFVVHVLPSGEDVTV